MISTDESGIDLSDLWSNSLDHYQYQGVDYYTGDYVIVTGIDQQDYFGRIDGFIPIHGQPEFQMTWLAPDIQKFKLKKGQSIDPDDFRKDVPLKRSIESVCCIKGLLYRDIHHTQPIGNIQPTSEGPQMTQLIQLAQSELALNAFVVRISSLLASNVFLFKQTFGESFEEWIARLHQENAERFHQYMTKSFKTEYLRNEYLLNGGFPAMLSLVTCEPSVPLYIEEGLPYQTLLSLFTNHFLLPNHIHERIGLILQCAAERSQLVAVEQFGWCPIQRLDESEFYTFHLNQLVRTCHAQSSQRHRTQSHAETDWKMHPHERSKTWSTTKSIYSTFIPNTCWSRIYDVHLPFNPKPGNTVVEELFDITDHHLTIYKTFELICCRVVAKLMQDYLCTVLKKVGDAFQNKNAIVEFVKLKVEQEMMRRK